MRKPLTAAALLAIPLVGVGYAIGQVHGPSITSAASTTVTPSASPPRSLQGPGGAGQLGTHADGTVTAISEDTVTVKADADTGSPDEYTAVTTIKLSAGTTYGSRDGSGTSAGRSSVTVGSYVLAWGTVSADGKTLSASRVSVMPAGGMGSRTAPGGAGSTSFGPPSGSTLGPSA